MSQSALTGKDDWDGKSPATVTIPLPHWWMEKLQWLAHKQGMTVFELLRKVLPSILLERVNLALEAVEAAKQEREACANLAEGWKGRRLEESDPESETAKAFGRGVDMAAHYIAIKIRERGV